MVIKKPYKIQDIGLRVMNLGEPSVQGHIDRPAQNEENRPRRFGNRPP